LGIKIGIGYDIHRLRKGRKLFLGGVEIPFSRGLMGHSDGDCLIHAIIDALLGAMGGGDIGQLFPDTDPKYKNIRSIEMLKEIVKKVHKKRGRILHIDTVVIAESPKIAPYIAQMKQALCPLMKIEMDALGIKAKTNEGIGQVGKGEAIAALAQSLLEF
jgi:2-C-methyl-D-erythritol 2,4-cyclodiphosphate synthase